MHRAAGDCSDRCVDHLPVDLDLRPHPSPRRHRLADRPDGRSDDRRRDLSRGRGARRPVDRARRDVRARAGVGAAASGRRRRRTGSARLLRAHVRVRDGRVEPHVLSGELGARAARDDDQPPGQPAQLSAVAARHRARHDERDHLAARAGWPREVHGVVSQARGRIGARAVHRLLHDRARAGRGHAVRQGRVPDAERQRDGHVAADGRERRARARLERGQIRRRRVLSRADA